MFKGTRDLSEDSLICIKISTELELNFKRDLLLELLKSF